MNWLALRHDGPMEPAANMAWDEALLESAAGFGLPVLRFYAWAEPAATFGYFQRYADVAGWTALRPLIRRPTGGGLVPHDADWTYSLVVPPGHPWHRLRATASYQRMHAWIQAAFGELGVNTGLAGAPRGDAPGQCFVGADQFDVLLQDRKIAGAAQRRTRDGLLIQGSIQPPAGLARDAFEEAFLRVAARVFGGDGGGYCAGDALAGRVAELVATKYSRSDYNERR